jgi:hypothetical protein
MKRPTLLPALALFVFIGIVHGETTAGLPSRQPEVVIPILAHFSPVDTSKGNVMHELKRILGNFDNNDEAGPDNHDWRIYSYHLNDGTVIIIEFKENSGPDSLNLTMITEQKPDGELKVLYGTAKEFSQNRTR